MTAINPEGPRYLMHNLYDKPLAKLIPGKEIEIDGSTILGADILNSINQWGIGVDRSFMKEHQLTGDRHLKPSNVSKPIFTIAFEKVYFYYALQKVGYKWYGPEVLLSDEEAVKYVMEGFRKQKTDLNGKSPS